MTQKIGAGLLSCADKIWETADTLRGAGIKASEWPVYMMPFFALMMLESRLRRFRQLRIDEFKTEVASDFKIDHPAHMEWLDYAARAANKGYHRDLLIYEKGLRETCLVPGGNFLNRLLAHLEQYDPDTKRLMGIGYAQGHAKFLDMQGKASDLFSRDNCPLFPFAQKWASIDLTPFDNSEITTIEEHIKRKWADISAETAGEQYTPSDVIDLASAIIVELRREGKGSAGIADVYDMACGGGNFLFATEDALRDAFPDLSVRTRGQELNDALYALAAIEARFRQDARIEWGNTLTNDLFLLDKFDAIVANPPYGVDWKDFKKNLEMDASGRFDPNRMPPTSDGQLLFLQHAAFHLSETGVATVVHSGSTLFSGDAGGGESETRRWLMQEQDMVEAIIQLPKNEFFNTGIHTYLWVLNRAKPASRKGFVLLVNAESCFTRLKRNLNMKNCEIDEVSRGCIVQAMRDFCDGKLLREELDLLALDARFIANAQAIKACPVLLLYTDKQGEASCASLNGGRNQDAVIDEFRRKGEGAKPGLKVYNALIVVVDKLLTGFDEPTLHTLFMDRGMDDVLLFQAACRVNRWRKWKNDCLLVDFSHDGVVSKNLPKVFAKYGGITVSDLDAMALKDKMDAAFKVFFDDKDIYAHWRSWNATQTGGKDREGATGLSDFLDGLVKDNKPRAVKLRRVGSAWLGSRERLWGILDFTKPELKKHANEKRAAFAEQVVKHLASKLRDDDDRVGAVFDIDLVEDAIGWGLDELPEAPQKKKPQAGTGLPHSIGGLMGSLDAIELLAALQLTEQQKLLLIEKLKKFLMLLFQVIDADGLRRNNDIHRKMILAMANEGTDFPWEERYAKFKELLDNGANSLKIFTHPDRKALLLPLMKRAELVMADYEEWIVSGGTSIVLSSLAVDENFSAGQSEKIGQLNSSEGRKPAMNTGEAND